MLTLASVMRSEMKKRKLEFSSHPGNLALMRNFVRHFLDNMPISERDRTLMVSPELMEPSTFTSERKLVASVT